MTIRILLMMVLPALCLASDRGISLHLPCEPNEACAQFDSEAGPVSLRKDPELFIDDSSVSSMEETLDQYGQYSLSVRLTPEFAQKFEALTERAIGKPLAIVVGTSIISRPEVRDKITGGNFLLASGVGKEPFWKNIPWIQSKLGRESSFQPPTTDRSVQTYSIAGLVALLAGLGIVLVRKRRRG